MGPESDAHGGMMRGVLGIPMSRDGSGTAWLPDDTTVHGIDWMAGEWSLMFHGDVFVGYDGQGSDAGDDRVVSQNWLMLMAGHPVGAGQLNARAMISLEPFTVGKQGYPLLLQTGETYQGMPLVDRQHPHDLLMELALDEQHPISDDVAIEGYAALAGEPALGPTAFPHRPSALWNPLAPISHHWLDSTHISYGVLTAGVFTRTLKVDASWFNGREPDENRLDVDLRTPDSFAARATVNPTSSLSAQASYGYLASPEALEPNVSVQRMTASATHVARLDDTRDVSTTLAFGDNRPSTGPNTYAVLAESAASLGDIGITFARVEYVTKTGAEFAMPAPMDDRVFRMSALSLGHVHPMPMVDGAMTAIGVTGTVDIVDDALSTRYGTRFPLGFMAYVQLMPEQAHRRM